MSDRRRSAELDSGNLIINPCSEKPHPTKPSSEKEIAQQAMRITFTGQFIFGPAGRLDKYAAEIQTKKFLKDRRKQRETELKQEKELVMQALTNSWGGYGEA